MEAPTLWTFMSNVIVRSLLLGLLKSPLIMKIWNVGIVIPTIRLSTDRLFEFERDTVKNILQTNTGRCSIDFHMNKVAQLHSCIFLDRVANEIKIGLLSGTI